MGPKRRPPKGFPAEEDENAEMMKLLQSADNATSDKRLNSDLRAKIYEQTRLIAELRHDEVNRQQTSRIRDEYTRRNVELTDENERLSTENRRIRDELEAGTCAQLHELLARIDDLERNLVVVKQRRDSLKSKFEAAKAQQASESAKRRTTIERINADRLDINSKIEAIELQFQSLLDQTEREDSVPQAVRHYLQEMAELTELAKERLDQVKKCEQVGTQLLTKKAELENKIAHLQKMMVEAMKQKAFTVSGTSLGSNA